MRHFLLAGITASLFTLIYGFLSTGLGLTEIRYQIVSPTYVLTLAACLAALTWRAKDLFRIALIAMIGLYVVVLVSATRSALIAAVVMSLFAFVLRPHPGAGSTAQLPRMVASLLASFALLAATVGVVAVVFPESAERFLERIMLADSLGFDYTTFTRLAEIEGQFAQLTDDPLSWFIGRGLGASYTYAGSSLDLLYRSGIESVDDLSLDYWATGHNFWVYSLFSQGIIVGMIHPLILLYCVISYTKYVLRGVYFRFSRAAATLIACAGISTMGILLATLGGNPMGSRGLALGFGFAVAVLQARRTAVAMNADSRLATQRP